MYGCRGEHRAIHRHAGGTKAMEGCSQVWTAVGDGDGGR